jgi:hypothetical protein
VALSKEMGSSHPSRFAIAGGEKRTSERKFSLDKDSGPKELKEYDE